MDKKEIKIRRVVIGTRIGGEWKTLEVITKRRARSARRRIKLCHECRKPILPGDEYYSDKILGKFHWGWTTGWHTHRRGWHYGPYYGPLPRPRFHIHLVCEKCWRGEKLYSSGEYTKIIDRSKPPGLKTRIVPFKARG